MKKIPAKFLFQFWSTCERESAPQTHLLFSYPDGLVIIYTTDKMVDFTAESVTLREGYSYEVKLPEKL